MTRLQLWFGLTLVGAVLAVLAMISGLALPALTVELVGSLMGVFLAISVSEVIRLLTDHQRGVSLRTALLTELKFVHGQLESEHGTPYALDCPVWTFAKNAGDIGLLDQHDIHAFGRAYSVIEKVSEEKRFARIEEAVHKDNQTRQNLRDYDSYMIGWALKTLEEDLPSLARKP